MPSPYRRRSVADISAASVGGSYSAVRLLSTWLSVSSRNPQRSWRLPTEILAAASGTYGMCHMSSHKEAPTELHQWPMPDSPRQTFCCRRQAYFSQSVRRSAVRFRRCHFSRPSIGHPPTSTKTHPASCCLRFSYSLGSLNVFMSNSLHGSHSESDESLHVVIQLGHDLTFLLDLSQCWSQT